MEENQKSDAASTECPENKIPSTSENVNPTKKSEDYYCDGDYSDLLDPKDTESVTDFVPEDPFEIKRDVNKNYISYLHAPRKVWENSLEQFNDETDERILTLIAKDEEAEKKLLDETNGVFNWFHDFTKFTGRPDTWKLWENPVREYDCPYESFLCIWDKDIMQKIADETNKYAKVKILHSKNPTRKWRDTNVNELYILFSLISFSVYTDYIYFSERFPQSKPGIGDLMSKNRFADLMTCLHFVDNNAISHLKNMDLQVAKIKPLTDYISNKFESLKNLNENINISDSIPLLAGQYLNDYYEKKITGIGKRLYELSDAPTGYVWRVLADPGRKTDDSVSTENDYGYSANIILKMTEGIRDKGHTLLIDECINSPTLARYLKKQGMDVVGPVRACHGHVPKVIKDLVEDDKIKKGHHVSVHCGDISINTYVERIRCRYYGDNLKFNNILSTFHDSSINKELKNKPEAFLFYNNALSVLDAREEELSESSEMMQEMINHKWYILAFLRLLKVTMWNCFCLYSRQLQEGKRLLEYGSYEFHLRSFLIHRHRPQDFLDKTRFSDGKHTLVSVRKFEHKENFNREKKWKCEYCKMLGVETISNYGCKECAASLCVPSCFIKFHETGESDYDTCEDSSDGSSLDAFILTSEESEDLSL